VGVALNDAPSKEHGETPAEGTQVLSRYVTRIVDGEGIERTVVLTRDGEEGMWLAQCQLPGHSLLDGTGEKRRDAVATVERKLIRATGGGILIGQYRTCASRRKRATSSRCGGGRRWGSWRQGARR
jgi:hypothetical protein